MDLTTSLHMEIKGTATKAADLDDSIPKAVLLGQFIDALVDGTGLDSANQVYTLEGAIGAGGITDVDLVTAIDDVFGDQIVATSIKAVFVHNTSTTAAVIAVGGGTNGAGAAAFDTWITSTAADGSEQVILPKNAAMLLWNPTAAGYAIAGGSDNLSFEETTTTLAATFDLMVICEV